MILDKIDFTDFFNRTKDIFLRWFTFEQVDMLIEFVNILADANFRCYRANMFVIDNRKTGEVDNKLIADMEWVARSVGEYRVASKANINKCIANAKTTKDILEPTNWMGDDIVYGIGEMLDRLSIETIKQEDFKINTRPPHVIQASQNLSNRVERYLIQKLEEINRKCFYECINEQRTYNLDNITEELVL